MPNSPPFRNEADFVEWIQRKGSRRVAGLSLGIGDDAALIKAPPGQELILTTDMSIENVHFDRGFHPPRAIGHRALARSISDIAAMGGTPRYALLSLAVSKSTSREWLSGFFAGLFALARKFSVAIIGGDTARVSGATSIDVILVGVVPDGVAVRRAGAREGDHIFVSGRLGLSALGLRLLATGASGQTPAERTAIRAHLYPQPQCALGKFLSKNRLASAMMDISDGLSTDLKRLCEASGAGAILSGPKIPAPSVSDSSDALDLALHGGEDYQLLFTVPQAKASAIPRRFGSLPLTCIGQMTKHRALRITTIDGSTQPLQSKGFDHFRRA
jgi:thiamine-monophosphate kinase